MAQKQKDVSKELDAAANDEARSRLLESAGALLVGAQYYGEGSLAFSQAAEATKDSSRIVALRNRAMRVKKGVPLREELKKIPQSDRRHAYAELMHALLHAKSQKDGWASMFSKNYFGHPSERTQ